MEKHLNTHILNVGTGGKRSSDRTRKCVHAGLELRSGADGQVRGALSLQRRRLVVLVASMSGAVN